MTVPVEATRTREWWTRPAVVLPIVATIAIVVALLTPQVAGGRFGDPRLSTHHAGALGARLLADMSRRMGWHVVQRDSVALPRAGNGTTVHALLAPVTPVTKTEAHAYLEAVRGGDALLYVLDDRTPLSDSLGVAHFRRGGVLPVYRPKGDECRANVDFTPSLWPDDRVHLFPVRWLRGEPAETRAFARLVRGEDLDTQAGDGAVGFALGRGRVIVVGDPDLLRNDVIRRCRWGTDLIAVQMLEWLRSGGEAPRSILAFDEYHLGFGSRPSVLAAAGTFLFGHPVGRALAMLVASGLVLLVAASARAIAPRDRDRIERRDPLEQVDALAHAYEQVKATRTITQRLLRGMRWRVQHGATTRAGSDDSFLDAAAARDAAISPDVVLVRRAMSTAVPERELPDVGEALRRIELSLTSPS